MSIAEKNLKKVKNVKIRVENFADVIEWMDKRTDNELTLWNCKVIWYIYVALLNKRNGQTTGSKLNLWIIYI